MLKPLCSCVVVSLVILSSGLTAAAGDPTLILHRGRIATVDKDFRMVEALAVDGDRIVAVGTNADVLKLAGNTTRVVDLAGKFVSPGLIDSHVHPLAAALTEFDHPIPDMQSIGDVLAYIRARARVLPPGEWIEVHQVFITRLQEQRYPTRQELDEAAPGHPVLFATGPDAALNSLALKLSGIDRDFKPTGVGFVEKDPATGEPTGVLRRLKRYVKAEASATSPTDSDRQRRLAELLADYNSVGITAIGDRDADRGAVDVYRALLAAGKLTTRVAISQHVDTDGELEAIQKTIRSIAADPLTKDDPMLRIVGIKTYLDGGMLTGSAYLREPWGVSQIYGISDPTYRGLLFIPRERLLPIVEATVAAGLQFTAHSVGDGAVHTLLDVYEEVNRTTPLGDTRPCITHSNFMSREAVEQAARLGVVLDIQPAWLYLDTRTLTAQFGYERLRYFQPLRTIFDAGVTAGGGSDHMQKIGSLRSINPYNPFLGIWTTLARRAKGYEGQLHPEEALTREEALRFYTINNARVLRQEQRIGSLEVGKQADFVVLDTDLLTCPLDEVREAKAVSTWLGGKQVWPLSKAE